MSRLAIPDVIAPDLDILYCGINPGLYSAQVGHQFARPGNRFWKAIHAAGLTPRLLSPFEDQELVHYGQGITNLVSRPTAQATELSREEFSTGIRRLIAKVRRYRPRFVVFLGVGAYRDATGRRKAAIGPQEERLGDARVWVLPNPSGRTAGYQLPALVAHLSELKRALGPRPSVNSR